MRRRSSTSAGSVSSAPATIVSISDSSPATAVQPVPQIPFSEMVPARKLPVAEQIPFWGGGGPNKYERVLEFPFRGLGTHFQHRREFLILFRTGRRVLLW